MLIDFPTYINIKCEKCQIDIEKNEVSPGEFIIRFFCINLYRVMPPQGATSVNCAP